MAQIKGFAVWPDYILLVAQLNIFITLFLKMLCGNVQIQKRKSPFLKISMNRVYSIGKVHVFWCLRTKVHLFSKAQVIMIDRMLSPCQKFCGAKYFYHFAIVCHETLYAWSRYNVDVTKILFVLFGSVCRVMCPWIFVCCGG